MKQALLVVSFGTSVPRARQDIEAVERVLAAGAPERAFCRAYTSPTIRRILAERGEPVPGLPEALEALSRMGMDRVPRRSKSCLQQLRLSVYTRQASIAIGLEDYAAARSQLAYLRDEVRTLPAGNALFGHFSKAVLDLEHMMAVQQGEPGGHTAYFRTELGLAPNSYLRAQASYYLACALLLEENDAAGAVPLYEQARALAPQLWVAAQAGAALNALHAQEAAQPSAGI